MHKPSTKGRSPIVAPHPSRTAPAERRSQRAPLASDDAFQSYFANKLGDSTYRKLASVMAPFVPSTSSTEGSRATELASPSSTSSRASSSYFDRYPERKLQGPYVPKAALVPTVRKDGVRVKRHSDTPSPASKNVVRFPTPGSDRSRSRTPSPPPAPSTATLTPKTIDSPAFRRSVRQSPRKADAASATAQVRSPNYVNASSSGSSGLGSSRQSPSAPNTDKPAVSAAKDRQVPSTFAASSAARGKSRSRPSQLTIEVVPSIHDIIQTHAGNLKPMSPPTAATAQRQGSNDAAPCGKREEPSLTDDEQRSITSETCVPSRNGVEIFVHANTSESSLDSVEQEIWDGMQKISSDGAVSGFASRCDPPSPRRRSYSTGTRAAEAEDLSVPFAQVRAFHSLAQLPSPTEAEPPLSMAAAGLQEPFVESKPQGNPSMATNRASMDRFKATDGGALTQIMMVKANLDQVYKVSYADVGSRTGRPVFVFLGLGAVRYLVGLYDELAAALGLRLICIDRWGLGRTDEVPLERRSILGWSAVVIEVADRLGISKFSVVAHSAGAPFAMATALVFPERLVGPVHLLSPFTGASAESGYRWLRYVPDGVIRTAQVAEWKLQGWKLSKAAAAGQETPKHSRSLDNSVSGTPPSSSASVTSDASSNLRGEGWTSSPSTDLSSLESPSGLVSSSSDSTVMSLSIATPLASPSPRLASGRDDKTTVRTPSSVASSGPTLSKKASLSFLSGLLGPRQSQSESSSPVSDTPSADSANLAYRNAPRRHNHSLSRSVSTSSSALSWTSQEKLAVEERCGWLERSPSDFENLPYKPLPQLPASKLTSTPGSARQSQNRVVSSGSDTASILSASDRTSVKEPEAGLGVALLRASHSESQRGMAADLSLVLGKKPWGFDFSDVRHPCRIWHGSRDERVSVASAKWMERSLADCQLKIVEGAGHNLMSNTSVIFEVLESIQSHANLG